tara:strand:- start:64 stop:501 length:438 start_codon:yes stop_codon:yes gene_type:complete
MDVAERFASLSTARKLKVGAIVVKDNRVLSIGYNGMPSGWDNNCEDELKPDWMDWKASEEDIHLGLVDLKTKPEVIHAEVNCLCKLAASNESGKDAAIYITHAPCIECAKMIYASGIKEVFYKVEYRDKRGIEFLKECNLEVTKL